MRNSQKGSASVWLVVIIVVLLVVVGYFVFIKKLGINNQQTSSGSTPSSYLVPGKVPDGYKLTSTITLHGYDSEYNYSSGKSGIQFREVGGYKSFDDYVRSWTQSNGTVVKEFTYNGNKGVVISVAASPSGPAYYELGYENDIFVERIISDSSLTPDMLIDVLKGMEVKKM